MSVDVTFTILNNLSPKTITTMKKLILIILCSLSGIVLAQAQSETLVLKHVKKGEEPKAVMEAVKRDFPKAIVGDLSFLPAKLYGEYWSTSYENNLDGNSPDFYKVNLKEKDGSYEAVYDKSGNVIFSLTLIKEAQLPKEITKALATKYPGWKIVNDQEKITYRKGAAKEAFRVQIQESNMNRSLLLSANGKVLKDRSIG